MQTLTVFEITCAVSGKLLAGNEHTEVTSVTSDSRKVSVGALFIPWKGERFDGHDFIDDALSDGAAAALTERELPQYRADKSYILVSDMKKALKALAGYYRSRFILPFVQVTGSTGKTTAKEMIAAVLREKYETLKTIGNFNGELGTPLLLLSLSERHEAAVVETGMDAPGQIRALGEIIRPHFAAIVNVGVAHMERLGSRENILKAKCEIFDYLDRDGVAILNGDDDMLSKLDLPYRTYFCGKGENCNVRISDVSHRGLTDTTCTVTTEKDSYRLTIPAPGDHMPYPAAMALIIAEEMGLNKDEIIRGIASYTTTGDRMRVERLAGGRIMLNDSYNANPQSMEAALRTLATVELRRRIAFLGDMKELGDATESGHNAMGRLAGELGIDVLFCTGPYCRDYMVTAAKEAGVRDVRWYATKDEAYQDLVEVFTERSALLLKGSHFANRLDLAADYLRDYQF